MEKSFHEGVPPDPIAGVQNMPVSDAAFIGDLCDGRIHRETERKSNPFSQRKFRVFKECGGYFGKDTETFFAAISPQICSVCSEIHNRM